MDIRSIKSQIRMNMENMVSKLFQINEDHIGEIRFGEIEETNSPYWLETLLQLELINEEVMTKEILIALDVGDRVVNIYDEETLVDAVREQLKITSVFGEKRAIVNLDSLVILGYGKGERLGEETLDLYSEMKEITAKVDALEDDLEDIHKRIKDSNFGDKMGTFLRLAKDKQVALHINLLGVASDMFEELGLDVEIGLDYEINDAVMHRTFTIFLPSKRVI